MTDTPLPASPPVDLSRLPQVLTDLETILGAFNTAAATAKADPSTLTPPVLSPIDKALGGSAMVGLKTPLAILAYAGLWIMQTFGSVGTATGDKATTTGSVLTALIAAFGSLGVTAKADRLLKTLGIIAEAPK